MGMLLAMTMARLKAEQPEPETVKAEAPAVKTEKPAEPVSKPAKRARRKTTK